MELAELLRHSASGHAEQAAVGLLIEHDVWLRREDFVAACVGPYAVDWNAAVRALDDGELPCSTSEAAVLRIAAGLGGVAVDLRAMLGGLDARNIVLVARAVMHANGTRHGEVRAYG